MAHTCSKGEKIQINFRLEGVAEDLKKARSQLQVLYQCKLTVE